MDGVSESKLSILVGLLPWSGKGMVVVRGSLRSPLRVRSGLYSVDYGRPGMDGNIFRLGANGFQKYFFKDVLRSKCSGVFGCSYSFVRIQVDTLIVKLPRPLTVVDTKNQRSPESGREHYF